MELAGRKADIKKLQADNQTLNDAQHELLKKAEQDRGGVSSKLYEALKAELAE